MGIIRDVDLDLFGFFISSLFAQDPSDGQDLKDHVIILPPPQWRSPLGAYGLQTTASFSISKVSVPYFELRIEACRSSAIQNDQVQLLEDSVRLLAPPPTPPLGGFFF